MIRLRATGSEAKAKTHAPPSSIPYAALLPHDMKYVSLQPDNSMEEPDDAPGDVADRITRTWAADFSLQLDRDVIPHYGKRSSSLEHQTSAP